MRWPAGHERLEELRVLGRPRLLLLEHVPPPPAPDCLEDWVRLPASDEERSERRFALARRASQHGVGSRPELDADGLLHLGDSWVSLSPVEQSLTSALLERFGAVVHRDVLAERAWPVGAPTRNALDVHVLRLRRRIAELGLEIRTVRSRGYLLQPVPGGAAVHALRDAPSRAS